MNKEKLTELVYEYCKSSMWTSRQVVEKILNYELPLFDVGSPAMIQYEPIISELVEIIKKYKTTGTDLQETADKIYNTLYKPNTGSSRLLAQSFCPVGG